MNEQAREVFLCPDCGGPSVATGEGDAACSDCQTRFALPKSALRKGASRLSMTPEGNEKAGVIQRNVVAKPKAKAKDFGKMEQVEEPVLASSDIEQRQKQDEKHGERRRRTKKRRKPPTRVYLGWLMLWLTTVAVIVVIVSHFQAQLSNNGEGTLTIEEQLEGEEREFYKREFPSIFSRFDAFLKAETSAQMSEYAMRSNQLDRRMTRYFKEHAPRRPTSVLMADPAFWNVAFEESPGFVEVVWDGKEAGFFEGVFLKVDDDWMLDWEQFTRYSSENWTLFHKKIGSQRSGVFRVYVEKISEGEDADFKPWMELRILPPHSEERRRTLEASKTILIGGDDGLVADFEQVFADFSGRSEGFSRLWSRDPRGLRRITVELAWAEDPKTGEERMVIKKLLSKNWRTLSEDAEHLAPRKETKKFTEDE